MHGKLSYCFSSLIQRMLGDEPERIQAVSTFTPQGIDQLTSVVMEYKDGRKAAFTCAMVLEETFGGHIDRFEIHGTKGKIKGKNFRYNGDGNLSYIVQTLDGEEEKVVSTPQNYRLEVEQMGKCITDGAVPAVTENFSMANARTIDRILEAVGY